MSGAWRVAGGDECVFDGSEPVCIAQGDTVMQRIERARLIAAAPDLLEALRFALPALEAAASHTASHMAAVNRVRVARAAIKKATGEQA